MKLKLLHKLLIALFTCTALVLVLLTLATRAQIGHGFEAFLQQRDLNDLEPMVSALEGWYTEHGSWAEMSTEPWQFHDLMARNVTFRGPEQGGRRAGPQGAQRPGPGGRREGPGGRPGPGRRGVVSAGGSPLHERVYLLDDEQRAVFGYPPDSAQKDQKLAIEVDGATVGWLGVARDDTALLPEEQAFMDGLRDTLIIGLIGGLLFAAALAVLMARHLSRPVSQVAGGIRALAEGDYDARVESRGGDEIARLGDDVNTLGDTLRENRKARKRWMSDMAHELRTPLAIIQGEIEAMADGVRPMDQSQLASVQAEIAQLGSLVDDLHNLAVTDSGALAYSMRSVDLEELMDLEIDAFRSRAEQAGLVLRYESTGQPVRVSGDAQRLRQLLHNLLDNSVAYTDRGGRITARLDTGVGQARITIDDTKPGASAEQCAHLFERLYRVEGSRNRRSGGSGLGLAICHNIALAHGGQIAAEPSPEGGLRVTVTLALDS